MATPKSGPTTAPMLVMPVDEPEASSPLATPPELEDIPDPVIPAALLQALTAPTPAPCTFNDHDALLSGFCMALQAKIHGFILEEHNGLMRTLDATLVAMRKWVETVGSHNEHADYTLGDALATLQARGLTVLQNPYTAVVEAVSGQGYPVTLTIAKRDAGELVQAIEGLTAWLRSAGYTIPEGVRP